MPKSAFNDENAKIAAAALRLAQKGWKQVTLAAVAKAAKIAPAALQKRFTAPHQLASVIAAAIDREAFGGKKFSGAPHDLLFDLLMARFDVLQKHRAAILHMAEAARQDRALACALMRATMDGAYRAVEAAGLTQPPRPALALGLTAIYGWAFTAWRKDQSRDMAKTMAALDRALRLAGKAAALVNTRA